MKKLAMLLAACMLCMGMAVYAEDAESAQTEAPEMEIVELDREVWRGEVTAVDADSLTLKIIEYNPENPRLPAPEVGMTELPAGEEPAEEAEDAPVAMSGKSANAEGEEMADFLPEDADGTPVEVVSITITEETAYYTGMPAESVEIKPEEIRSDAEDAENDTPLETYVFEEAAPEDVLVGDILTVEIVDGVASIVVIETDSVILNETDM